MSYTLVQIFTYSIFIPALIGWVRFKKTSPIFFPFFLFIWLGTLNEVVSYIVIDVLGQYNIFNYNIYLLVESLILTWQFTLWKLFGSNRKIPSLIFCVFIGVWLVENLFISKFFLGFNSYSRILFSFGIVLMSIGMLNDIILKEKKQLAKNSIFIICCLFIILFTYALLTESFIVYGVSMNDFFRRNLYRIFTFVNFLCNLAYALAILWMPKRQAFTLQY
jgi:hypothetical protein